MTFIIRHPAQEVQFLKFAASPTETRPIPAGRVVRLSGDREVDTVSTASSQTPFGWLMQLVKDPYTDFPSGYMMRGDIGSTHAFVGDPVGIVCGPGAVYETDQYVDEAGDGIDAGTLLYPDDNGQLSDSNADSASAAAAIAMNALTATQCAAGAMLMIKALV